MTANTATKQAAERAAIHVADLWFGYETGVEVVRGVGASAQPGRLTALLGPNAAGKTTLLRLMLGQLEPRSGEVLLNGEPVRSLGSRKRAARMSYVPQRSHTQFAFTVRQVVAMGRFALRVDDGAVSRAMDRCDLNGIADRPYLQLSAGQQQRVLLGRAMAQAAGQGTAMLLDEPTASMDLQHVHGTMARLRALAAGGMAIVVVLHDVNLAAKYADDVWLMQAGAMAAAGAWDDVLTQQRLSDVYALDLRVVAHDSRQRPVFAAEPSGTLSATADGTADDHGQGNGAT